MNILKENSYDFTDSIMGEIKRETTSFDYLLTINCYIGETDYSKLVLRLKNVKKIEINVNLLDRKDIYAPYTLSQIIKREKDKHFEFICESADSLYHQFDNGIPLLCCICDEVYIEKNDSEINQILLNPHSN